jgi:hypothetical protein
MTSQSLPRHMIHLRPPEIQSTSQRNTVTVWLTGGRLAQGEAKRLIALFSDVIRRDRVAQDMIRLGVDGVTPLIACLLRGNGSHFTGCDNMILCIIGDHSPRISLVNDGTTAVGWRLFFRAT